MSWFDQTDYELIYSTPDWTFEVSRNKRSALIGFANTLTACSQEREKQGQSSNV